MCVYSMIMDHYYDKWKDLVPNQPTVWPPDQFPPAYPTYPQVLPGQAELDEFRELLRKAREYDKKNNQPDCELEEKKEALQKIADALGIPIRFPEDE